MTNVEASNGFRQKLSAETYHPLLYRPLVEFMIGCDWRQRSGGGRDGTADDRVLQRRSLADRLPQAVRQRSTKGSDQQLREQAQMASSRMFTDLLEDSYLVRRGWVVAGLWREQVARAQFGVFDGLGAFDAAVASELWLRTLDHPEAEAAPELRLVYENRKSGAG
jgi:hypothetical protein